MKKFLFLPCFVFFSFLAHCLLFIFSSPAYAQVPSTGWPTVGANLQRTNWTPDELASGSRIEWYRPIDAYIPPNFQVIAANDLIYISTARGLYALKYDTGAEVWRYNSEIPLGNSPTIATVNGVSYAFVGGYDKKLHAFNALTGASIWEFTGAKAGYQANPLVVNNTVIAANRDGYVYALNATTGSLVWQYPPAGQAGIGVVHQSPAYKNGVIYLVSDSFYAYAINENGTLKWKSPQKLPNSGFDSFWPVVYTNSSNQDFIIFTGTIGFREYMKPGTYSAGGETYDFIPSGGWKVYTTLRGTDGTQVTPALPAEAISNPGNQHPPTVSGINNLIYETDASGSRAYVKGWQFGSSGFASTLSLDSAPDEPQIVSGGGNNIFRNLCCARIGDYQNISSGAHVSLWNYSLDNVAPGYDERIYYLDKEVLSNITGAYGDVNGIYGYHGDQNPIISYKGKAYVHRGNAVLAFGTGTQRGKITVLPSTTVSGSVTTLTDTELKSRLETEVGLIMSSGGLIKPGYYDDSHFSTLHNEMDNYFDSPGDTLYTLSLAYPYLSSTLQTQVKTFLKNTYIPKYFNPTIHFRTGWAEGVQRGGGILPTEVTNSFSSLGIDYHDGYEERLSWMYNAGDYLNMNPTTIYAMWKFAANVVPDDPTLINTLYQVAKNRYTSTGSCSWMDCIHAPAPRISNGDAYLILNPHELNAYIAGLQGFEKLQDLAGKTIADASVRTRVDTELTRLINLKINNFTVNSPFNTYSNGYEYQMLNLSRNFLWMTPELADILRQRMLSTVTQAVTEYNKVGPYWFVSRFNAATAESAMQNLYDYPSMFAAKAYILKDSREELSKWVDAPAFQLGDLFHIQNLVAAIQAPMSGPSPTSTLPTVTTSPACKADLNTDHSVNQADLLLILQNFSTTTSTYDMNGDGKVNMLDAVYILKNWGGSC